MGTCCFRALTVLGLLAASQVQAQTVAPSANTIPLEKLRMRDPCILADAASKTYYLVGSAGRSVRAYTSTDLVNWQGPQIIFTTPADLWGDIPIVSIWAPELHAYRGKYYLFLTFDTRHPFAEQWRNWPPRVTRGSQVLAADAPGGPFRPFQSHSTLPPDMMTLDGTLWVEDSVPYMVFCHEWVQIKDGTVEYIRLKGDLSETVGDPTRLFDGSDAPWSQKSRQYGSHVTDAPFLHKGRTGKLYLMWAGFSRTGYTEAIAISASGKLAGPWTQQAEPLYTNDGGHGMLFTAFEGKLMMVLHAPNGPSARPHLFEMTDTGETLKIIKELAAAGEVRDGDRRAGDREGGPERGGDVGVLSLPAGASQANPHEQQAGARDAGDPPAHAGGGLVPRRPRGPDVVTVENAVDPGPNRTEEPFIEKFSLPAAVRFLDATALTWQKQRNCFACHSGYAFLLARPAVSHKVPAHAAVRLALEHLAENPRQTDYGVTEAVMVASTLAQNDAATTGKLHPSTHKALDRIWTLQREDGGWTWVKNNEPPSEVDDHYGVTIAALGVGMAPEGYSKTPAAQKGLEKIRQYLRNNPPVNMHQRAMVLLASLRVDGIMTEAERRDAVGGLLALQKPDGGWGLATLGNWKRSDGKQQDYESSDGYGTGFVLYVLRGAGLPAGDSRIQKGIAWLKTHQRASGRWFTRSMKQDSTHLITYSGTAYGILALALCGESEHLD